MTTSHRQSKLTRFGAIAFGTLLLAAAAPCLAGDWPQILGPSRNGIAADEALADTWPADGPSILWKRAVGEGFAGVAVAGKRVIVFHRVERREVAEAIDAETGKPLWKTSFPTTYVSRIADDNGPRCVPLVHKQRVFLVGAGGQLHCVELAGGKTVWSRSFLRDFDVPDSYFGAGSSPIVADDKLLLNVGGRDGAGIVAFALDSGKTLWKATDAGASYSSPVLATIDGTQHAIFAARLSAVSVDPASGRVRFSFPFGKRGPTVNGANPLVLGSQVFLSASYGIGAKLADVSKDAAELRWSSDELISSQYTTSIYKDGMLYGVDGRQDIGVARLRCLDVATRKIRWSEEEFGYATLILAGDKLLAMKTDGELVLARAQPDKFALLAKAKIVVGTTRALPALSSGRLYVRSDDSLYCVQVGAK